MTEIVMYHPERDSLTTVFFAWELIERIRLGWEIIGEGEF